MGRVLAVTSTNFQPSRLLLYFAANEAKDKSYKGEPGSVMWFEHWLPVSDHWSLGIFTSCWGHHTFLLHAPCSPISLLLLISVDIFELSRILHWFLRASFITSPLIARKTQTELDNFLQPVPNQSPTSCLHGKASYIWCLLDNSTMTHGLVICNSSTWKATRAQIELTP